MTRCVWPWRDERGVRERFGYVYIVSAAGKTAEQMLELARVRLKTIPASSRHRRQGAAEDHAHPTGAVVRVSTLSTHVLDTVLGVPAKGVRVTLRREGVVLGADTTDEEGRNPGVPHHRCAAGPGKLPAELAVAEYWKAAGHESFYPRS